MHGQDFEVRAFLPILPYVQKELSDEELMDQMLGTVAFTGVSAASIHASRFP